jgi:hypothetical protein
VECLCGGRSSGFARGVRLALALLASCSTNHVGALSSVDLPSNWGLHQTTTSASDQVTREVAASLSHPASGCHHLEVALFAPLGKAFIVVSTEQRTPFMEVISYVQTCGSGTDAIHDFDQTAKVTSSVPGIGDDARITSFNNENERSDLVLWRTGQVLGFVGVEGPPNDRRITPAAAERLARRAADDG